MNLNVLPSLMFDTTILEDGVIRIPDIKEWKNQDIHIIIVFKQNIQTSTKPTTSLAGRLKKYANPNLIDHETDLAWSDITDN